MKGIEFLFLIFAPLIIPLIMVLNYKLIRKVSLVFFVFALSSCCVSLGQQREEFNGPMESWTNVKNRFRAKGDGRQDDTRALQQALDSLTCRPVNFNTGKAAYTVIYLPKGRYRITSTLVLRGKIGVNIIGEDPDNTIIEWGGGDNDTMFWSNGSAYFKISRITFQGNKKKDLEGLGIHWKDRWNTKESRSFASLNIEISDCVFRGLSVGIGGGNNWNDSEIKINRCSFYNSTRAGIEIRGYNALDYWIWYSRFYDCNIGVSVKSGNYHVYNSYFRNSAVADVDNTNSYYTSVRGCFSEQSRSFSIDNGASENPFKRVFQDNIVKQTRELPIYYHHIGKPVFMGNRFDKTKADTTGRSAELKGKKVDASMMPAVIQYTSWAVANFSILSIENQFYYPDPFRVISKYPKKNYVIRDSYGKRVQDQSAEFLKKLPGTPPLVKRKIFTVPLNAGADEIQSIINQAAKMNGKRPVVHFRYGNYVVDRTITIPAGSDMQIVGDGMIYSSTIVPAKGNAFRGTSVFSIIGPNYSEIRDIQFTDNGQKRLTAIELKQIDQKGSKVYLDQLYALVDTSLFVDRLNYTQFEKNNSFFADGNVIIGGDIQKAGNGTMRVHCFGGGYSRLSVMNNAKFVSKDCWWEGPSKVPLDIKGDGDISIDNTLIAPNQADSLPIVKIGRFKGKISLMNAYVQGGMEINPDNPELRLFLWNLNFYYKKNVPSIVPSKTNGQIGFAGINSQCFVKDDPYCTNTKSYNDRFVNVRDDVKFIDDMTRQTRDARPVQYGVQPNGVSNFYLTRVSIDSYVTALHFKP